MPRRVIIVGIGLLAVGLVSAADRPPASPPPPPLPRTVRPIVIRPIGVLIAKLDARSFAERQKATRELALAGAAAAAPLGKAARQKSLEVAARAIGVLERMYTASSLDVAAASEEVLEQLAIDAPRRVARRAKDVLAAHTSLRQRRAVLQVTRLGGVFQDRENNVIDPNSPGLLGQPIYTLQLGARWQGGDKGLRFIRRLTQLQSLLVIQGVKASPEKIAELASEMPNLRVAYRGTALLGVRAFTTPCQIQEVRAGLAAARADIQVGDVVKKFDGKTIEGFQQLVDLIKKHQPGDKVPITVERKKNGKTQLLEKIVVLDAWEAGTARRRPAPKVLVPGSKKRLKRKTPKKR